MTKYIHNAKLAIPSAVIENIEYYEDRHLDKAQIQRLATCKYIDEGHHIIFKGASGNGKTYLACALGNAACRRFKAVRYDKFGETVTVEQTEDNRFKCTVTVQISKTFYIYTSENDAEQEARECTSHFCEILTKKGVLVSNIEKVGMFAEIATAFQAHQSATPSVTNVDDENDDEDDEDENNETTDENQSVIVEKKDNPRIIGQSFTTANLVQEILDNDSCFSCYEIDLCVERVRRGAKKLVPGEDRVPKNIMVSDYSGDKYRAKISSIEILPSENKETFDTAFADSQDAIIVGFSVEKPRCVLAFALRFFQKTDDDARKVQFYEFADNSVVDDSFPYVVYQTSQMDIRVFSSLPTEDNAIGHSLENGPRKKDNDKRVANFKKLGKVEREKILLAVPNFFNSLNCTKNEVADINKKLKV